MAVNARNGIALSGLSAINGIADVSAINGQSATLGGGGGGITYFDGASLAHGATTSPTVNYPASIAENDIMLVAFCTDTVHVSSGTPPTGWTKILQQDGGTNTTVSAFWKRAGAGQGTSEEWTNIYAGTEVGLSECVVYRGVIATGDPQDATATSSTGSGTAHDQSITTATNNAMVIGIIGTDPSIDPTTFAWDSPINERLDVQNGTSALMTIGDVIKTTAGAQNMGGDWTNGSDTARIAIALKPA